MNKIERGIFKFKNGITMIFRLSNFFPNGLIDELFVTTDEGKNAYLKRTRMSNLVTKAIIWEEVDYDKSN